MAENESPTREEEFQNAKAFLLTRNNKTGLNLYDHLSKVVSRVLDERPGDVVDVFEEISYQTKRCATDPTQDTIADKCDHTTEVDLCQIHEKLYKPSENEEEEVPPNDDEVETPLPNLMELAFYFEQAGVGMSREECYRIWLAIKQLVDEKPLQHVRLWGKILGTEQNYYIAEVEYRDGDEEEEEAEEAEPEPDDDDKESETSDENENAEYDEIPESTWKPPPVTPREENRSGANKKTYFVCNEPGKPWVKLPPVTPQQINVARQMKKFLTGRLDAYIVSYPPFPGNEANYLRAQIARISAGTHISPLDYYQFDDEEENYEDDDQRDYFVENLDFEVIPVKELCDPELQAWVHHVQHILPQGRCAWWNPTEEEFEEEDEEEARQESVDEPEPEEGPPLLTPLSEDAEIDNMPPWSTKLSSNIIPQYAIAVLKSNLWPGAFAFCCERKFENIYIGWGHKYSTSNFTPEPLGILMQEFESGPEVTEVEDPTVEEEIALRDTQNETVRIEEEELSLADEEYD